MPLTSSPFGASPNSEIRTSSPTQGIATWRDVEFTVLTYDVHHGTTAARHKPLGVSGQVLEDLGRAAYTASVESIWFGPDWERRLDNLLYKINVDRASGLLVLPDGRSFNAGCLQARERRDYLDGCEVSLSFEEDSFVTPGMYVRTYGDSASSYVSFSETAPEAYEATKEYVDDYLALLNSPTRISAQSLLEAYRLADAALYEAEQGFDLDTGAGCEALLAVSLLRWRLAQAVPSPTALVLTPMAVGV
jgi:hypothetical protein